MGKNSNIEWTDGTWNPWHGCRKISAACKYCYMFRDKQRYGQDPSNVVRSADKTFYAPLKWREPQRIFTCSWSDFFIEEADEWRDEALAIMALTPQHTYQILTKRTERMREYLSTPAVLMVDHLVKTVSLYLPLGTESGLKQPIIWPLPNVWLGVSVEDQKAADERIPLLLETPAAVRFLSVEPLLGPVDLQFHLGIAQNHDDLKGLVGWTIVGGESGPNRRVAKLEWIESIVEQCKAASVPVFVKQIELNGKVEKDIDKFPKHLQVREFPEVK